MGKWRPAIKLKLKKTTKKGNEMGIVIKTFRG